MKYTKLSTILVLLMCMVTVNGCNKTTFKDLNNYLNLQDMVNSFNKMNSFRSSLQFEPITFSQVKSFYDVKDIKNTHQGYYVIVPIKHNYRAFIFFNNDNLMTNIVITDQFKSKKDYSIESLKNKTFSDILLLDPNSLLTPFSGVTVTAHIIKEGICFIKYSYVVNDELLTDPIVDSVIFYDNEEILMSEDENIRDFYPYIMEEDKNFK